MGIRLLIPLRRRPLILHLIPCLSKLPLRQCLCVLSELDCIIDNLLHLFPELHILEKVQDRQRGEKYVGEEKPLMLIGSPPPGPSASCSH